MKVVSVNVGQSRALMVNGRKMMTAIGKQPVEGFVAVAALGLAGDEQVDLSVHGGLRKAVYAYPAQHYAFWQTVRAQARVSLWDEALPWGSMGENLTLDGLDETRLWVGDELRLPSCRLAVTEPRQPCSKFNAVMGFDQAAKLMQQSGYCGTYLTVLQAGAVAAGEEVLLVPGPRELSLMELFRSRGGKPQAR